MSHTAITLYNIAVNAEYPDEFFKIKAIYEAAIAKHEADIKGYEYLIRMEELNDQRHWIVKRDNIDRLKSLIHKEKYRRTRLKTLLKKHLNEH